MNFNTLEYLLFLPLVVLVYWQIPAAGRKWWLLGMSWIFYFSWDPVAGLLLVGTTLLTWLCARGIDMAVTVRKSVLMGVSAVSVLGVLFLFKYAGFIASMTGKVFPLNLMLPVGISFYTFQTLAYVTDVYRGKVRAESSFLNYALFVSFFPQLVAGPIERSEHLIPQLCRKQRWNPDNLKSGGWLLLSGYFKKAVLADGFAPFVDRVYGAPEEAAGPAVILATVLFGLQIYCDFSGYTDIARGSARLLGIDLTENFRRPYRADSIQEFWRRWHISLTGWFRDYVYIPLGGSRKGTIRHVFNILAVFLLSGLWHGAGWTFLLWGGIHGIYLSAEVVWSRIRNNTAGAGNTVQNLRRIRTFLLTTAAWLFFRAESLSDAGKLIAGLARGYNQIPVSLYELLHLLLMVLCFCLVEHCSEKKEGVFRVTDIPAAYFMILAIAAAWLAALSANGQNAFIYFQF